MAIFVVSSFGTFVMDLFHGLLTGPSWQSFVLLACGWAVATDRHTSPPYLWLTGATTVQHFARCSVCRGCPLSAQRWHLWGAVIRQAAQFVPEGEGMAVVVDDTPKKKAGTHRDGLARYRNGAGAARQAYHTWRGLHFVIGLMRIPLPNWPGPDLSVPGGLELYLKPTPANALPRPYRSRRQWARALREFIAEQLPTRHLRRLADGGDAPKDAGPAIPQRAHAVGRWPGSATLYQWPPMPPPKRRGAPRKNGALIGSPKPLAQTSEGWSPWGVATFASGRRCQSRFGHGWGGDHW